MILIRTFLLILLTTTFLFAQDTDKEFFFGDWKTEPNQNGMIEVISLTPQGTGTTGPARINQGRIEFVSFLKSDLEDWTLKGDTLVLTTTPIPTDNKGNKKSMTLLYIILDKDDNLFTAIYSDPEMDKMMEEAGEKMEPIKLTFKKTD